MGLSARHAQASAKEKALEVLRVGDSVFAFDGTGLSAQRIVKMERLAARLFF